MYPVIVAVVTIPRTQITRTLADGYRGEQLSVKPGHNLKLLSIPAIDLFALDSHVVIFKMNSLKITYSLVTWTEVMYICGVRCIGRAVVAEAARHA